MNEKQPLQNNPLGTEKISKLLPQFAIPSIIGMVVNALYNIVDQIFIGWGVGYLGNAATNVDFPLGIIALALAMLFGMGAAIRYSIEIGAGRHENAARILGNSIFWLITIGILYFLIVRIFLKQILTALGATPDVLPYCLTYSGIMCCGIPLFMLGIGLSHIIRADGSPRYSMMCMLLGCAINVVLDPILIFHFDMGIAGAAIATIISQIVALAVALAYLPRLKNARLTRSCFKVNLSCTKSILSLGVAGSFNQLTLTVVQIAMNRSLVHYGALSVYGSDIPLACAGVIGKVNLVFFSLVIGMAQGCQPIFGFNFGAQKYDRVKEAYRMAIIASTAISFLGFLSFQIFPRQIISIFGESNEVYVSFAVRYFRIFLMFCFVNGIQPVTATFLTATGKAGKGLLLSLTRQIFLLLPLILLLPLRFGIDGVMYAGPIADVIAAGLAVIIASRELKKLNCNAQLSDDARSKSST